MRMIPIKIWAADVDVSIGYRAPRAASNTLGIFSYSAEYTLCTLPISNMTSQSVMFKGGLPADCTCPICEQALRDPIKLNCDHHYCRQCFENENR